MSSGKIMYGMHFYPGLAQYNQPNNDSYKIFLNEDTLRKMDPTFSGKPIFVEHVEEVDSNLDSLRKEADGWVVESFFNAVDGKHWVKMVIVSDRADRAIKRGFRLSNAYIPKMNGRAGEWNGISYQNEVIDGEYEHLAIVQNPRYDESVIMSPEEFKMYNENLQIELKRIANSNKEENNFMNKLKFWNRKPVENSLDFSTVSVTLPKSGKEFTIYQIINAMDEIEEKKKEKQEEMKNKKKNKEEDTESDLELKKKDLDVEGDLHNEEEEEDEDKEDKKMKNKKMKNKKKCNEEDDEDQDKEYSEKKENEEDEEDKKMKNKKMKNKEKDEWEDEEKKENEDEEDEDEHKEKMKNKKMKNELAAKKRENFETLKNAHLKVQEDTVTNDNYIFDKVANGKLKYGSN